MSSAPRPELHQDRTGLAAPVSARIFEGRVARVHPDGDPLVYPWGNEYRDLDELAKIVGQMAGKPVTLDHPDDLIANGAAARVIGQVLDARLDGDHVVARILVFNQEALDAVAAGTRELSLGYTSRLDDRRRQVGIKIDHLAVVERARCGPTCELRADRGAVAHDPKKSIPVIERGLRMLSGHDIGVFLGDGPDVDMVADCACARRPLATSVPCASLAPVAVGTASTDADLNAAAARHAMPSGMFAVPSREALPIEDAGHVRAAMARFNQTDFKSDSERRAAFHRIIARAHELSIDTKQFAAEYGGQGDSASPASPPVVKDIVMEKLQEQLAAALTATATEKSRADQAEAALAAARADVVAEKSRADKAEGERDGARADAAAAKTAAEQNKLDSAAKLPEAVRARVALETKANAVMGAADREKLADRDIKVAIIKHVDGIDVAAEKSADYVEALFDGAVDRHARAGASRSDARKTIVEMRQDGAAAITSTTAADDERAALDAYRDRQASAWMHKN